MEWRSVSWSEGWSWLEPVLWGATVFALLSAVAGCLRVRVRTRRRRPSASAFVRRVVALVGLGLALSASPSPASGRPSAHPGRSSSSFPEAPWKGTSGFSPPHPLVPSGTEPTRVQAPAVHPAIHRPDRVQVEAPLFERARGRRITQREKSRRVNPAGQPQSVKVDPVPRIKVRQGDCLWTIAAETLGSDDPVRVDSYWRSIYRLNHSVIGADPDYLLPDLVLRLPRKATG